MFVKKSSTIELPKIMQQKIKEQIKSKELNHQFFLLVRDKKYEQAYSLGMAYLKYFPQNQAIQKFCYFIKHNREELAKMVDQQENYTDDSDDSDQDEDQNEQQQDNQSVVSHKSSIISQKSSVSSQKSIISVSNQVNSKKSINYKKTINQSKSSNSIIKPNDKQNNQNSQTNKWSSICKNVYNERRKK